MIKRLFSLQTPKFHFINKAAKGLKTFALLDVGSGNHSPSKIKTLFPACEYHGIDLDKEAYSYNAADDAAMTAFYQMDLTQLKFDEIPDAYFDVITMAHIIEHLHNGDDVIRALEKKLKPGGFIYIEYPGPKSLHLPSMYGTLNFKDDPTHVRVYTIPEMLELMAAIHMIPLQYGTRRSAFYIAAMPIRILSHLIKGKKLRGDIFWDALGFAEFMFARKPHKI